MDSLLLKPGEHGEQIPSFLVDPAREEVMPVSRRHHGLSYELGQVGWDEYDV